MMVHQAINSYFGSAFTYSERQSSGHRLLSST